MGGDFKKLLSEEEWANQIKELKGYEGVTEMIKISLFSYNSP